MNQKLKILKAVGVFFVIWIFGGVILDMLQFGMFSGAIAFAVGVWVAYRTYKKEEPES